MYLQFYYFFRPPYTSCESLWCTSLSLAYFCLMFASHRLFLPTASAHVWRRARRVFRNRALFIYLWS